ncbi:XRE family transcriptional regulator [Aureimonas sp. SK2]|uniref:XRE family transcriptional regulator n=1 Tax=Aureimonas sp. SK2 TaxID=3015992 RepID=UPI0024450015|nr:XRE family transcriptional regulator [Aureimonas sp. SK2]
MQKPLGYGTGNVFRDIGVPDPDEHLRKADIAIAILDEMEGRGLDAAEVAAKTGTDAETIRRLTDGQFDDLDRDQLEAFLAGIVI